MTLPEDELRVQRFADDRVIYELRSPMVRRDKRLGRHAHADTQRVIAPRSKSAPAESR